MCVPENFFDREDFAVSEEFVRKDVYNVEIRRIDERLDAAVSRIELKADAAVARMENKTDAFMADMNGRILAIEAKLDSISQNTVLIMTITGLVISAVTIAVTILVQFLR